MKTILLLLIIIANTFTLPDCCLTSKYDSLKAVPKWKWSAYPCLDPTFNTRWDELVNTNTCEKFQFSVLTSCKQRINNYVYTYYKISPTVYVKSTWLQSWDMKTPQNTNYAIIPNDTIRNWCDPNSSIENNESFLNEKILNIKVYSIQGKLLYSGKSLNINKLVGIFLVEYITDKRTYFKKKLFY